MPKISLAVMENRVREFDGDMPRSTVKKMAKLAKRRFESFTQEPTEQECLELFRTITYGDPVGDEAARHLDNPEECTHYESMSRRLSLAAA